MEPLLLETAAVRSLSRVENILTTANTHIAPPRPLDGTVYTWCAALVRTTRRPRRRNRCARNNRMAAAALPSRMGSTPFVHRSGQRRHCGRRVNPRRRFFSGSAIAGSRAAAWSTAAHAAPRSAAGRIPCSAARRLDGGIIAGSTANQGAAPRDTRAPPHGSAPPWAVLPRGEPRAALTAAWQPRAQVAPRRAAWASASSRAALLRDKHAPPHGQRQRNCSIVD